MALEVNKVVFNKGIKVAEVEADEVVEDEGGSIFLFLQRYGRALDKDWKHPSAFGVHYYDTMEGNSL